MAKIRVLDENLINKIAAGEVIENPASVVKELVENSIDAGATEICVEIQGGGRQLIRITDDGCGMDRDDALLCLERHATSKIKEIDDIHAIHTMGFRGEAIPSIASISKFTLLTCPQPKNGEEKNLNGTLVIIDGGNIIKCCDAVRSPGTTIEVKALFFNVPVRKKFQKSPTYDANEIQKMLSSIALGNPSIKFQLINNQTSVFSTAPILGHSFQEKLGERISSVMGEDFFQALCPISSETDWCKMEGWIGQPCYNRQNRSGQYLFINQRPVVSPLISYSIRAGYGTALPPQRHPVFVIHLTLPGTLVDVNVHPQKREVRLRQEQQLRELIAKAIETGLQGQNGFTSSFETFSEAPFFPSFINLDHHEPDPIPTSINTIEKSYEQNFEPRFEPNFEPKFEHKFDFSPRESYSFAPIPPMPKAVSVQQEEILTFDLPVTVPNNPVPRVLSTIPGYIIADSLPNHLSKGLCIIDQRAAHARILFEKLLKKDDRPTTAQPLLIPHTIHLTPIEGELLREHLEELNQLGIDVQDFGGHTFAINSLPSTVDEDDISSFVTSLVHSLRNIEDKRSMKVEKEMQLAVAASRAAVSSKKVLSLDEAQGLLKELMKCETPYHCPQGKPTIVNFSPDDLAKQFEKVGST